MNNSYYPSKSIKTIEELSKVLDETEDTLNSVSINLPIYYKKNVLLKKDGGKRTTYIVKGILKRIQQKIKNRILDRVCFAEYLFFGIKKRNGIIENAKYHCKWGKPKALLSFDIKNFYPSVTENQIKNIWVNFFKFSEAVAILLTKLTAFLNELPQGVSTSVLISNLIFFESEKLLAQRIRKYNANYSRYADDISITFKKGYTQKDLSEAIRLVVYFIGNSGFKLNWKKFKITTTKNPMVTNKSVCINNGYLSLNPSKRKEAYSRLKKYKSSIKTKKNINSDFEYQKLIGYLRFCYSINPHKEIKKFINEAVI
ncbi:MAG TPA: reverse transcriptase family protein [Gammaproteobacteria bacterium]|nr:reverse transcriptase family protein [Gammaproteobacteria bacterium]